jgi:cytochrome c peroxidase
VPAVVIHSTGTASTKTIRLPADFGFDAGRDMFHAQTQVGITCGSCHPEGHNDGLTWTFEQGIRRTQDLGGGVMQRAPFHWTGDMNDLPTLMQKVFAERMLGGEPTESQQHALGPFLDRIPAPAAPVALDAAAVIRGEALFESTTVGCATCHNGALLTNRMIVNVGTGQLFKVPSLLGVGGRAPFLHDGCAATLADRFGACGGGDFHGKTSTLTAGDIADLVAFLDTL